MLLQRGISGIINYKPHSQRNFGEIKDLLAIKTPSGKFENFVDDVGCRDGQVA